MSKRHAIGAWLVLTLCALTVWLPLHMLLTGAIMGAGEATAHIGSVLGKGEEFVSWPMLPRWPTLRPLIQLLMDTLHFFPMFWNACLIAFPAVVGQVLIAAPAAWGLARGFRGARLIYLLYVALMLMPFQVMMVPSYLSLNQMGLMNTRAAVILPAVFSTFPVFILYRFFKGVPAAFIEAAQLDGAGPIKVFTLIGLPLGMPGMLSVVVLGFLEYWSALEQPLTFLRDPSLWPISLFLSNIATENAGAAFSASLMTMLPAMLIFLWGQPYLEEGIRAAGLKE